MSSKKYEIDAGSVWFPSRFNEAEVISLRYSRRGHALELWALVKGHSSKVFRIPFNELLLALNVPRNDL